MRTVVAVPMLRLVLALLALLSPAALFLDDAGPREPRHGHDAHGWVPLDFSLPASDAWVAIPLTAVTDAVLDARVEGPGVAPGETESATVFLTPIEGDERFGGFGASWGGASTFAQVNLDGDRIACCDAAYGPIAIVGGPGGLGSAETGGISLFAGQTVWLTLIAAHADLAEQPTGEYFLQSGEVSVGTARRGTDVSYVDLVDEAYLRGTSVRLLDATIGEPGIATRAWEPATNGIMFLFYWAHGDSSATISARANGATVLDRVPTTPDEPGMVFAMGLGDYGVELRDLKEERGLPLMPSSEYSTMSAMALFADIDVPGFGLVVHPNGEHAAHPHP